MEFNYTVKDLDDRGFTIGQINQLMKMQEKGLDITFYNLSYETDKLRKLNRILEKALKYYDIKDIEIDKLDTMLRIQENSCINLTCLFEERFNLDKLIDMFDIYETLRNCYPDFPIHTIVSDDFSKKRFNLMNAILRYDVDYFTLDIMTDTRYSDNKVCLLYKSIIRGVPFEIIYKAFRHDRTLKLIESILYIEEKGYTVIA